MGWCNGVKWKNRHKTYYDCRAQYRQVLGNLPMTLEMSGRSGICPKTARVGDLNQVPERVKLEGRGECMSACQVIILQDHSCTSFTGKTIAYNPSLYGDIYVKIS